MVNVHARYLDVLETEGWLDRGARVPADRQADRRAPGGRRRADDARVRRADRLHEERQRRRDGAQPTCPTTPYLEADLVATSRRRCASASPTRSAGHRAAPRDHRHPARQPDGQPVGHLVRPPHDRGHRRVGGRRDPGVGGRRATCSTSPALWDEIDALDGRGAARHPARPVPRLPADGRARRRCGCCATAGRRSTSPRRSPSSGRGSPSWRASLEPVLRGRMADVVLLGRGVAARRRRARGPRRAGRRCGRCCTPAFDVVELAGRAPGSRVPSWPRVVLGAVRPARPDVAVGRRSARCPAPTAGRPRPARRCATTC